MTAAAGGPSFFLLLFFFYVNCRKSGEQRLPRGTVVTYYFHCITAIITAVVVVRVVRHDVGDRKTKK